MIGMESESAVVLYSFGAIQLLGLVSAGVTRVSEGSRCQTSSQQVFLGFLGTVGLATVASIALWPGCWLASGATLAVMVLTVTCDFGRSRRVAAV